MTTKKIILILLVLIVIIAAAPLLLIPDSEFGGADGAVKDAVSAVNPDYKPWADPILKPPGGETESLLFSFQAGLGAGILGFCFGYLVARKKYKKGA